MPCLDKNIALQNLQDSSKKKQPIKEPSSIPFHPLKTREAILYVGTDIGWFTSDGYRLSRNYNQERRALRLGIITPSTTPSVSI